MVRARQLGMLAACVVAFGLAARAEHAAYWRFEGRAGQSVVGRTVVSEVNAQAMAAQVVKVADKGRIEYDSDVPTRHVYDPLTKRSVRNQRSLRFLGGGRRQSAGYVRVPFDLARGPMAGLKSFTVELFAKAGLLRTASRDVVPIVRKWRRDKRAATWEIQIFRAPQPHSYNWWQAAFAAQVHQTKILERNRYKGATHVNNTTWRHLALVHDAARKRISFYVDYTLTSYQTPGSPLIHDRGSLLIGGQREGIGYIGHIDEVRISRRALEPHEFLRAVLRPLEGVSFAPRPGRFPADAGFIDVRLRYGAVGDGTHDDTKAIQRAFAELADRIPIEYNTLYFPPGTYLVSDTVQWTRFMAVQGAGQAKTIIKLKDHCAGFRNPAHPRPVLSTGYGPRSRRQRGRGDVIRNFLYDLTIDTGTGNPGAVGVDFQSNNVGGIDDVTIRSGDGAGKAGLDFTRPWPGPSLIKRVRIEGFDYGIRVEHKEYSLVFEDLTLEGQRVAGIHNRGNMLSMRHVTSRNRVPAIHNDKGGGMIVLLDSELAGGDSDRCAIVADEAVYARNIRTRGYRAALRDRGKVVPGSRIAEHVSGEPLMLFPSPKRSLGLPIEDTPTVPWDPPAQWANVHDFAAKTEYRDWSRAIQAAIDSGKPTVYFPPGKYPVKSMVRIRGRVRRLFGMHNAIVPDWKALGKKPALRFESRGTVVVERLALYALEHASAGTLVVRHTTMSQYRNTPGCGPLFLEDVGGAPWRFAHPQRVYARQLNAETRNVAEITNDAAQLWILGLKTEYESTNLINGRRAATELLGGLIYPVGIVPADLPMFINAGRLSLICCISAYRSDHQIYVQETRGTQTKRLLRAQVPAEGGRRKIHLYAGYPGRR